MSALDENVIFCCKAEGRKTGVLFRKTINRQSWRDAVAGITNV